MFDKCYHSQVNWHAVTEQAKHTQVMRDTREHTYEFLHSSVKFELSYTVYPPGLLVYSVYLVSNAAG